MDVRRMQQVLAIHRHGSFIKAAEELGVAQPTLSRSIARLEDVLGVKLFERSGAGAKVTPMGALIVERAEKIIADTERLTRDIGLVATGEAGEARIGVGPGLRAVFLPRFALALARRRPNLTLEFSVQRRDRLLADLLSGALDVALFSRTQELEATDLVQVELMTEPLVAVAGPSHPLTRLPKVSMEALLSHPVASGSLAILPPIMIPDGAEVLAGHQPAIICNDDATLKHLVLQGLVTVFANQHLVQAELDAGELVALPLELDLSITAVAVMTRAASHAPIMNEIVELAAEICRPLIPASPTPGLRNGSSTAP